MLDDAVFARRIEALQDSKKGPAAFGVEPLLQFRQPLDARFEKLFGVLLLDVEAAGVAGVDVGQLEVLAFVGPGSAR